VGDPFVTLDGPPNSDILLIGLFSKSEGAKVRAEEPFSQLEYQKNAMSPFPIVTLAEA
jgi:hypothetical protein